MRRVAPVLLMFVLFLAAALGEAMAKTSWPARSSPLSSTLGWFKAINAHDRKHLLFYVAPSAQPQMGWAQPSRTWPKFKSLACRSIRAHATSAHLRCTFDESGPPSVVGNPDSEWDVYLRRTGGGWLIYGYGQG